MKYVCVCVHKHWISEFFFHNKTSLNDEMLYWKRGKAEDSLSSYTPKLFLPTPFYKSTESTVCMA